MTDCKKISSCCFTGHRSLPKESLPGIRHLLESAVAELFAQGCRSFISGGAVGFDLLAARVVLQQKEKFPEARLVLALPCRDQHAGWGASDRRVYEEVLSRADRVIYLCEKYCTGCMHLRNKYMVNNSDICIAYLNHRGGGTEFTVEYAREQGKRVVNLAHML